MTKTNQISNFLINREKEVSSKLSTVLSEDNPMTLHILSDEAGLKLAQKLYKDYCDENNFRQLFPFMLELDKLFKKYRGDKPFVKKEEVKEDILEDNIQPVSENNKSVQISNFLLSYLSK